MPIRNEEKRVQNRSWHMDGIAYLMANFSFSVVSIEKEIQHF